MLQVVFDAHTVDPKLNSPSMVFVFPPKSCTVVRNGYHDASTFTFEADSRVLPFDPDAIASCAARVYMWDSQGDENKQWMIDENEMIRGVCDDIDWQSGDGQKLTVSGRDYQGVLDEEWNPKEQVPAGASLEDTIQAIADKAAPKNNAARFAVEFRASGDDGEDLEVPIIGSALRSTKRKGLWVKPGKTFWDLIYEMCLSNGFIVYIGQSEAPGGGAAIIIDNPRTQIQRTLAEAPRVVYGKDLLWLKSKRKLGKQKVPRIIMVYWDPRTKQKVEVVYPKDAKEITTGLGLKKNEDMRIPAPKGVIDKDTALRYAKMRWDLMARAESEYTFRTAHMTVAAANAEQDETGQIFTEQTEFNILRLRAGDAVGIRFDPFNLEHLRSLQIGERTEFVISMGYSQAVASFVASNVDRITQFKQPYYAHKITYEFDEDNGIEIEVEGVNFASEAREIAWADGKVPDAITGAG